MQHHLAQANQHLFAIATLKNQPRRGHARFMQHDNHLQTPANSLETIEHLQQTMLDEAIMYLQTRPSSLMPDTQSAAENIVSNDFAGMRAPRLVAGQTRDVLLSE